MITCANHDVLVNNMLPVSILVTEQFTIQRFGLAYTSTIKIF